MSKIYVDRLIEKYNLQPSPEKGWSGLPYNELMKKIIAKNLDNTSKKINRINNEYLKSKVSKITKTEKPIELPTDDEVLPKRSVTIKKGADRGSLLTQNIRDMLTSDLREVMNRPDYSYRRGPLRGEIKLKAIEDFQKKITGTFSTYTKKDPLYGIPSNIKTIARTEFRSAASEIRGEYMKKLAEKNHDVVVYKTWKHNGSKIRGYVPREGHIELNGYSVEEKESFPLRGRDGRMYKIERPHDPSLPAGEFINCSCECIYSIKKRD